MRAAHIYGFFAAAYGTCVLSMLALSFLTQSQVDLGPVGFWGPLLIAALYAAVRTARSAA